MIISMRNKWKRLYNAKHSVVLGSIMNNIKPL